MDDNNSNMVSDTIHENEQTNSSEQKMQWVIIKELEHIVADATVKGKEAEVKHLLTVIEVSMEMLNGQEQLTKKLQKKNKQYKKSIIQQDAIVLEKEVEISRLQKYRELLIEDLQKRGADVIAAQKQADDNGRIIEKLTTSLTEKEIEVSRLNVEREFLLDNMRQLNIKCIAAQKCADDNELVIKDLIDKIAKAIDGESVTSEYIGELLSTLQQRDEPDQKVSQQSQKDPRDDAGINLEKRIVDFVEFCDSFDPKKSSYMELSRFACQVKKWFDLRAPGIANAEIKE